MNNRVYIDHDEINIIFNNRLHCFSSNADNYLMELYKKINEMNSVDLVELGTDYNHRYNLIGYELIRIHSYAAQTELITYILYPNFKDILLSALIDSIIP
jgi:hypothetical protein